MIKRAEWSKSYKHIPRDNLLSHAFKSPKFTPSFENDPCPPHMSYIIGWEYGRMWIRERDAFKAKRDILAKPKRIKNDFKWWLDKRNRKSRHIKK